MRKYQGFTLIELIVFIIVTSILASAILLAYIGAMGASTATVLQNTTATATARGCADWYLAQRQINGYSSVSGTNCTSPLAAPSFCAVPTGYTLTASCSATTVRSDSNYETITISVTGLGRATLTLLLGEY